MDFRRGLLDLRINVAVGNEQVQPSVIVVIEKASPEAEHIMRGTGNTGLITDFVEKSFAIVVPEVVGRSLEIGDIEIKPAIIVIVTQRNAHRRHHSSLGSKRHPAGDSDLFKSAVVLVVVEIGRQTIGGDEQIRPTVVVIISSADRKILALRPEDL